MKSENLRPILRPLPTSSNHLVVEQKGQHRCLDCLWGRIRKVLRQFFGPRSLLMLGEVSKVVCGKLINMI